MRRRKIRICLSSENEIVYKCFREPSVDESTLAPLLVFVVVTIVVFLVVAAFLAECCLGEAFRLDL